MKLILYFVFSNSDKRTPHRGCHKHKFLNIFFLASSLVEGGNKNVQCRFSSPFPRYFNVSRVFFVKSVVIHVNG